MCHRISQRPIPVKGLFWASRLSRTLAYVDISSSFSNACRYRVAYITVYLSHVENQYDTIRRTRSKKLSKCTLSLGQQKSRNQSTYVTKWVYQRNIPSKIDTNTGAVKFEVKVEQDEPEESIGF